MSTVSDIVILYQNGETIVGIARSMGIPRLKVNRILRLEGVELRQSPAAKKKRWKKIAQLHKAGLSATKIARRLGVSVNSVRHALKHGCQLPERANSRRHDYPEARHLRQQGMSYCGIAKRLNMSRLTVEYALLDVGDEG